MSIVSNLLRSAPPPSFPLPPSFPRRRELAPVKLGLTHVCVMLSEAR